MFLTVLYYYFTGACAEIVPLAQYARVPPIFDNWLFRPTKDELKKAHVVKIKMRGEISIPIVSGADPLQSGVEYINNLGTLIAAKRRQSDEYQQYEKNRQRYISSHNERMERLYFSEKSKQQKSVQRGGDSHRSDRKKVGDLVQENTRLQKEVTDLQQKINQISKPHNPAVNSEPQLRTNWSQPPAQNHGRLDHHSSPSVNKASDKQSKDELISKNGSDDEDDSKPPKDGSRIPSPEQKERVTQNQRKRLSLDNSKVYGQQQDSEIGTGRTYSQQEQSRGPFAVENRYVKSQSDNDDQGCVSIQSQEGEEESQHENDDDSRLDVMQMQRAIEVIQALIRGRRARKRIQIMLDSHGVCETDLDVAAMNHLAGDKHPPGPSISPDSDYERLTPGGLKLCRQLSSLSDLMIEEEKKLEEAEKFKMVADAPERLTNTPPAEAQHIPSRHSPAEPHLPSGSAPGIPIPPEDQGQVEFVGHAFTPTPGEIANPSSHRRLWEGWECPQCHRPNYILTPDVHSCHHCGSVRSSETIEVDTDAIRLIQAFVRGFEVRQMTKQKLGENEEPKVEDEQAEREAYDRFSQGSCHDIENRQDEPDAESKELYVPQAADSASRKRPSVDTNYGVSPGGVDENDLARDLAFTREQPSGLHRPEPAQASQAENNVPADSAALPPEAQPVKAVSPRASNLDSDAVDAALNDGVVSNAEMVNEHLALKRANSDVSVTSPDFKVQLDSIYNSIESSVAPTPKGGSGRNSLRDENRPQPSTPPNSLSSNDLTTPLADQLYENRPQAFTPPNSFSSNDLTSALADQLSASTTPTPQTHDNSPVGADRIGESWQQESAALPGPEGVGATPTSEEDRRNPAWAPSPPEEEEQNEFVGHEFSPVPGEVANPSFHRWLWEEWECPRCHRSNKVLSPGVQSCRHCGSARSLETTDVDTDSCSGGVDENDLDRAPAVTDEQPSGLPRPTPLQAQVEEPQASQPDTVPAVSVALQNADKHVPVPQPDPPHNSKAPSQRYPGPETPVLEQNLAPDAGMKMFEEVMYKLRLVFPECDEFLKANREKRGVSTRPRANTATNMCEIYAARHRVQERRGSLGGNIGDGNEKPEDEAKPEDEGYTTAPESESESENFYSLDSTVPVSNESPSDEQDNESPGMEEDQQFLQQSAPERVVHEDEGDGDDETWIHFGPAAAFVELLSIQHGKVQETFMLDIEISGDLFNDYNLYNSGWNVKYWLKKDGGKLLVNKGNIDGLQANNFHKMLLGQDLLRPYYDTAFLQAGGAADDINAIRGADMTFVDGDGGLPSIGALNNEYLDDFQIEASGGMPNNWRDPAKLATWVGEVPVLPGILWCVAHAFFLIAFFTYLVIRFKHVFRRASDEASDSESVISGESIVARNGSVDIIPDQKRIGDCVPPLQAQRNIKVTLYRDWWACKALHISWFCLLIATVITGYLCASNVLPEMMLLYTIIGSIILVEASIYCFLCVGLGAESRFGLVRVDSIEGASCVFVEELEGLPMELLAWHKKNGKKVWKRKSAPKSICATHNTPFLKAESHIIQLKHDENKTFFMFGGVRYSYSFDKQAFVTEDYTTVAIRQAVNKLRHGLPDETVQMRRSTVGWNIITSQQYDFYNRMMSVCLYDPTMFGLLFGTFALPYCPYRFYDIMQVCMIIACVLWATRVYSRRRKDFGSGQSGVDVLRDNIWVWLKESYLVPGDIYMLRPGQIIPCDSCLLNLDAYVDESVITGAPFPMKKIALSGPRALFGQLQLQAQNQLYAGSTVVACSQRRTYAVATETGSCTVKGQLSQLALRFGERVLIMKKNMQKFCWFSCIIKVMHVLYRSISILTTYYPSVTPPCVRFVGIIYYFFSRIVARDAYLLCAHLTMFVHAWLFVREYCARLLKQVGVDTSFVRCLPVAGNVNMVFFDKTGVLTSGKMSVKYVAPVITNTQEDDNDGVYSSPARFEETVSHFNSEDERLSWTDSLDTIWRVALGSCHACKLAPSGEVQGNNVDAAMFNVSNWKFKASQGDGLNSFATRFGVCKCMEVVRTFPFDGELGTSGVIVQHSDKIWLIMKGAMEAIVPRCRSSSIPFDFREKYQSHLKDNNYIVSFAVKELRHVNIFNASRSDLERDLQFIGLLAFQDEVREESKSVVQELNEAGIPTCIISGDDIYSAISAAKQVGIVSHGDFMDIASSSTSNKVLLLGQTLQSRDNESTTVGSSQNTRRNSENDGEEQYQRISIVQNEPLQELFFTNLSTNDKYTIDQVLAMQSYDIALTSCAFRQLKLPRYTERWRDLLPHVKVVGRCKAIDKVNLVRDFQQLGKVVGFCGDGYNDSPAMTASDCGIALSASDNVELCSAFRVRNGVLKTVLSVLRYGRMCYKAMIGLLLFGWVHISADLTSYVILTAIASQHSSDVYCKMFNLQSAIQLFIVQIAILLSCFARASKKLKGTSWAPGMFQVRYLLWWGLHLVIGVGSLFILLFVTIKEQSITFADIQWQLKNGLRELGDADLYDTQQKFLHFVWLIWMPCSVLLSSCVLLKRRCILLFCFTTVIMGTLLFLIHSGPSWVNCLIGLNCDNASSWDHHGKCLYGPQLASIYMDNANIFMVPRATKEQQCRFLIEGETIGGEYDVTFNGLFGQQTCTGAHNCIDNYTRAFATLTLFAMTSLFFLVSFVLRKLEFASKVRKGDVEEKRPSSI